MVPLFLFSPGKAPSLLFPTGGDIRHLELSGNDTGSYGTVAQSQGSLGALDVWWEEQMVFWTDLRKGTIKRARIGGEKLQEGPIISFIIIIIIYKNIEEPIPGFIKRIKKRSLVKKFVETIFIRRRQQIGCRKLIVSTNFLPANAF